jgi:hypothetical protein
MMREIVRDILTLGVIAFVLEAFVIIGKFAYG